MQYYCATGFHVCICSFSNAHGEPLVVLIIQVNLNPETRAICYAFRIRHQSQDDRSNGDGTVDLFNALLLAKRARLFSSEIPSLPIVTLAKAHVDNIVGVVSSPIPTLMSLKRQKKEGSVAILLHLAARALQLQSFPN